MAKNYNFDQFSIFTMHVPPMLHQRWISVSLVASLTTPSFSSNHKLFKIQNLCVMLGCHLCYCPKSCHMLNPALFINL